MLYTFLYNIIDTPSSERNSLYQLMSNINTCTRRCVHDVFVVFIVVTEGDFRKIRFI